MQLKLAWLTELRDQLGNDPIEVCGRRFAVFGPRVELQSEDSRLLLGAISSDILVRPAASRALALSVPSEPAGLSSAIPADPATHWSITDPAGSWSGGTTLPRWKSMVEMRAFGADFDALSTAEKTTKRVALYFSPSIPYFQDCKWVWKEPPKAASVSARVSALRDAPEGQINVYEWEEIYGIAGDKDSCCMTDGAGQISVDLLLGMPSIDSGRKSDRHNPRQDAPFAVQARLWAHGGLAKGMWVANPDLPKRTILVGKDEQLKIRARPGCPASLYGTPSFEVLRTMDKVAKAKLGRYLLFLLEHNVGEHNRVKFWELILDLQRIERDKLQRLSSKIIERKQLRETLKLEFSRNEPAASRLIMKGFDPLTEPFLQIKLNSLLDERHKQLREGKLVLPSALGPVSEHFLGGDLTVSTVVVALPDPCGCLPYDEVFHVTSGMEQRRQDLLADNAPLYNLVYKDPGMHPGDLRKVKMARSDGSAKPLAEYMKRFLECAGSSSQERINVVFFSTKGDPNYNHRSLADMISGGDYDGDKFQMISWKALVDLVENQSPPFDKAEPLPPLQQRPGSNAAARKRPAPVGNTCADKRSVRVSSLLQPSSAPMAVESTPEPAPSTVPPMSTSLVPTSARASRARQAQAQAEQLAREREETARQEQERQAQRQTELLTSFLNARFRSSAIVGSSAIQWFKFVDGGGPNSPECLHLNWHYTTGLDAAPPTTFEPGSYKDKALASALRSNRYPAWTEDTYYAKRLERHRQRNLVGGRGGNSSAAGGSRSAAGSSSGLSGGMEPRVGTRALVSSSSSAGSLSDFRLAPVSESMHNIVGKLWSVEPIEPAHIEIHIDHHITA